MKLSLSADDFAPAAPSPFITIARMGEIVRANRLHADQVIGLSGRKFRDVATANSMHEAENQINRLVYDVRNARQNRKEARQSVADALEIAKHSENPHQLHYLASMFINEPDVIRLVAKNPRIDQKTQLVILNDSKTGQDPRVLRNLGDNPAIGPEVMRHLLNHSNDSLTQYAVARNAARKSLQSKAADTPYVKICDELADHTFDPALRLIALAGVRDPAVMRKIVRTHDTAFGARELEAVADNIHAPKDVLAQLANVSGPRQALQAAFGVTVARRAAQTLAQLTHPEMDRDAAPSP
jgi:hypothetical protein